MEFIFVIVMRGESKNELISRIVDMSEDAQQDLYMIINAGAVPEEEEDPNIENLSDNEYSKEAQYLQTIERLEKKNEILREKQYYMETEADEMRTRIEEYEKIQQMLKEQMEEAR